MSNVNSFNAPKEDSQRDIDWDKELTERISNQLKEKDIYFKNNKNKKSYKFDDAFLSLNVDDMDIDDIRALKERLKDVENKVKENNKPKTITISSKSHKEIKEYCERIGHNIGDWCESILMKELDLVNCIIEDSSSYDEFIEKESDRILNKYKEIESNEQLVKTNNILLPNKYVSFKGYSILDGYPIYKVLDIDMVRDSEFEFTIVDKIELSNVIKYNDKLDVF